MNKRTQSEHTFKHATQLSKHLSNTINELKAKQSELIDIKNKVEASKPILQTIYGKFKEKESRYEDAIKLSELKTTKSKALLEEYKELYENGLRIMQKNELIDQFIGKTNYRNVKSRTIKEYKSDENRMQKKNEGEKREELKRNVEQESIRDDKITSKITAEQIYAKYRAKIGTINNTIVHSTVPEFTSLQQKASKLVSDMQNDLTRIQLLRQKSKSVLGLSKMPIEGSEGNNGRMKEPKATEKTLKDTKEMFLRLQREKLKKI